MSNLDLAAYLTQHSALLVSLVLPVTLGCSGGLHFELFNHCHGKNQEGGIINQLSLLLACYCQQCNK